MNLLMASVLSLNGSKETLLIVPMRILGYTVCRYVERNAVRAGLVERAEDWVWSSAWARLHPDDPRALPLADWPIPRPADWLDRVNPAMSATAPPSNSKWVTLVTFAPPLLLGNQLPLDGVYSVPTR